MMKDFVELLLIIGCVVALIPLAVIGIITFPILIYYKVYKFISSGGTMFNLFKWPKRYVYECGSNLQDVAVAEFNHVKPDLEKLYGRKIKVINMKRKNFYFEYYKVIFELGGRDK